MLRRLVQQLARHEAEQIAEQCPAVLGHQEQAVALRIGQERAVLVLEGRLAEAGAGDRHARSRRS